jgi:hypothetical protein
VALTITFDKASYDPGDVIRIKAEWSGKTIHESAPFPGKAFRKFRTLNLGYARVNCYTAA